MRSLARKVVAASLMGIMAEPPRDYSLAHCRARLRRVPGPNVTHAAAPSGPSPLGERIWQAQHRPMTTIDVAPAERDAASGQVRVLNDARLRLLAVAATLGPEHADARRLR